MKDIIKLHDRKFKIMIPAEKIDEAVSAVAQRINEDYGDKGDAAVRRRIERFVHVHERSDQENRV